MLPAFGSTVRVAFKSTQGPPPYGWRASYRRLRFSMKELFERITAPALFCTAL
jgi:hypothetical protein